MPWRWVCAACGSTNWQPTGSHIWCQACYRKGDDPRHDHLRNLRTGELRRYDRL